MGHGYGSEWQLTRFLGRHRRLLTSMIAESCELDDFEWLDFEFGTSDWLGDSELKGLGFLPDASVREDFRQWWPHGSGIMNWDAVGQGRGPDGSIEWVLVEAKGNLREIQSSCGAGPTSLVKIRNALDETRKAAGVESSQDWTGGYYQHANRLAVVHFLDMHGIVAHLVDVYFTGSTASDTRSPADEAGWVEALDAMKAYLGLDGTSMLEARAHEVFVDVSGES